MFDHAGPYGTVPVARAILGPALVIAVSGAALMTVAPFLGAMWMGVWGPYVLTAWVLAAAAILLARRNGTRQMIGLLAAWVCAVPLGVVSVPLVGYLVESYYVAGGVMSGPAQWSGTPIYYWFVAPLLAVAFAIGTVLALGLEAARTPPNAGTATASQIPTRRV